MQHAVDAEPDGSSLGLRLEVDVATFRRSTACAITQLTSLTTGALSTSSRRSSPAPPKSSSSTMPTMSSMRDVLASSCCTSSLTRASRADRVAGDDLQIIDGVQVGRIDHRHHEHPVRVKAHRDRLVASCGLLVDERRDRRVDPVLGVEHAHAHLQGHGAVDLIFGDLAGGNQDLAELAAVGGLAGKRLFDVFRLDETQADQRFTQRHTADGRAALRGALLPRRGSLRQFAGRRCLTLGGRRCVAHRRIDRRAEARP